MGPMKRMLIASAILFALGSCVRSFKPTTMEGAQCKKECAIEQQRCQGSSYTCDRGYSSCIEACLEIEGFSKGKTR